MFNSCWYTYEKELVQTCKFAFFSSYTSKSGLPTIEMQIHVLESKDNQPHNYLTEDQ